MIHYRKRQKKNKSSKKDLMTTKGSNDSGLGSPSSSSGTAGGSIAPSDGTGARSALTPEQRSALDRLRQQQLHPGPGQKFSNVRAALAGEQGVEYRAVQLDADPVANYQQRLAEVEGLLAQRDAWIPKKQPMEGFEIRGGYGSIKPNEEMRSETPAIEAQGRAAMAHKLARFETSSRAALKMYVSKGMSPDLAARTLVSLTRGVYVDRAAAVKRWTEIAKQERALTNGRSAKRRHYKDVAARGRPTVKRYGTGVPVTVLNNSARRGY